MSKYKNKWRSDKMNKRLNDEKEPVVVFYSRTGNTKKVGELIAQKLNCKSEEIIDNKNRKGPIRAIEAVIRSKAPTTIQNMSDPHDRLVIIGTPIWWYSQTPAVKAYLEKYKPRNVAFFFTTAVDKNITAFVDMENTCGVKPIANLGIDRTDMKDLKNSEKVELFTQTILKWLKKEFMYTNIDKEINPDDKKHAFTKSIFTNEINIDLTNKNYYNNSS